MSGETCTLYDSTRTTSSREIVIEKPPIWRNDDLHKKLFNKSTCKSVFSGGIYDSRYAVARGDQVNLKLTDLKSESFFYDFMFLLLLQSFSVWSPLATIESKMSLSTLLLSLALCYTVANSQNCKYQVVSTFRSSKSVKRFRVTL